MRGEIARINASRLLGAACPNTVSGPRLRRRAWWGLVQDHAFEPQVHEILDGFGAARDQPRRDDSDAARTAPNGVVARCRILNAAFIHPLATIPDCRREPEQRVEFALPLLEKRLGSEDEHRLVPDESHELGRHRKLQCLPEPDLIGQYEPCAMRPAVGVEGELHEILLVLPKADFLAVDRSLDDYGCGVRLASPLAEIWNQLSTGKAIHILDDEICQPDREWRRPEGVELLLDPCH